MTKRLLFLSGILLAVALFFVSGASKFFTLQALKENHNLLLQYRALHPVGLPLLFIGAYMLQTALSLPGAAVMTLAAGAIFGAFVGTAYAVTGATGGAVLAFLLTRYLFRDMVQQRFGTRLSNLNQELENSGINYLLFLRLVPLFPFFLINLAAALTRLGLGTFAAGTFVGIIPGGFIYANAGASLATVTTLRDVASPRVIGAFALLGLLALVPVIYRRVKQK